MEPSEKGCLLTGIILLVLFIAFLWLALHNPQASLKMLFEAIGNGLRNLF